MTLESLESEDQTGFNPEERLNLQKEARKEALKLAGEKKTLEEIFISLKAQYDKLPELWLKFIALAATETIVEKSKKTPLFDYILNNLNEKEKRLFSDLPVNLQERIIRLCLLGYDKTEVTKYIVKTLAKYLIKKDKNHGEILTILNEQFSKYMSTKDIVDAINEVVKEMKNAKQEVDRRQKRVRI